MHTPNLVIKGQTHGEGEGSQKCQQLLEISVTNYQQMFNNVELFDTSR